MTPSLTPEDRTRLRDDGEHRWIVMDGCGHCYLCGQTLHMPAHELPEFGCLPLPDQLQKVADHAGTFARSTIALLLASAAKALPALLDRLDALEAEQARFIDALCHVRSCRQCGETDMADCHIGQRYIDLCDLNAAPPGREARPQGEGEQA